MANKYIIHGATFNGDGTSSAAAASNGGVGAWNTITYFEGTTPAFGTLVAGDVVYIRTKDAAGAEIAVSKSAAQSLGVAAATELAPVTWVFDAGTVWSGVSGTVTYTMTTTSTWTVRAFNNLMATNYNLVIRSSNTAIGNVTFCAFLESSSQSVKLDCSSTMTSTGPNVSLAGGVHTNLWLVQGSVTREVFIFTTTSKDTVLISPKIEVLGPWFFGTTDSRIFSTTAGHSSCLTVFGGEVSGASMSSIALVTAVSPNGSAHFYGLKFPASMVVSTAAYLTGRSKIIVNGSDGVLGNWVYDYYCEYSSRYDGFYPTLNATLESSGGTPWVYRLHTYRTTQQNPAQIALSKMWTQAAAVKTVTVNLLWPTSMAAPNVGTVWITVAYTDSVTGLQVFQITRAFTEAALAASSAVWTGAWNGTRYTYGATQFDRYQLAVTTSSSIKQDTPVMVSVFVTPRAASAAPLDIIMVCPDPIIA